MLLFSDGRQQLVAANVGDARIVLSRAGQAIQLSFDHKVNTHRWLLETLQQ
jgi:serine/threonine protein phosphatase PrpC